MGAMRRRPPVHRAASIGVALAGGACSPSVAPSQPAVVVVTESASGVTPDATTAVSTGSTPSEGPSTPSRCAKRRYGLDEAMSLCGCDEVGALADGVCGTVGARHSPTSRGDIAIEVKANTDPVKSGETVTFEVVIRNQGSAPLLIGIDFVSITMLRRFAVHDPQSVRVDRPDDDARCQNNYTRELTTLPQEPPTRFVLLPGAEVVDRVTWEVRRASWGAPTPHAPAVGIPTCEVVASKVPLKAGRYIATIHTGIAIPRGLSEASGHFFVDG